MNKWEQFEEDSTNYLKERFGSIATFTHQGGSDASTPDILVTLRDGSTFYVEAKLAPAQSGQFVLTPNINSREFDYSQRNTAHPNYYSQEIINQMNTEFEDFRNSGTAGKTIIMEEGSKTFENWIVNNYKEKGVKFFITNNFKLIPIDEFGEHFYVTAKYRIKRSGSSGTEKTNILKALDYMKETGYPITSARNENDRKLFVTSEENLHNERFVLGNNEFMLSSRSEGEYEVRKLSNTYNANVIFSITGRNREGLSEEEFAEELLS